MGLDRSDDPPSGAVTRRVAQMSKRLVDFHLESYEMILDEAYPTTHEALLEHGKAIRQSLSTLRKAVFRLENNEPDLIIVEDYQLKKSDMTANLACRVKQINAMLVTLDKDQISLLSDTMAAQLDLEDSLSEHPAPGAEGYLRIPTAPLDQTPVDGAAGGRPEDLGQRTRNPPPKDNLPPPRMPKKEERPPNEEQKEKTSDETETSFTFRPPSASSPRKPPDLLRKRHSSTSPYKNQSTNTTTFKIISLQLKQLHVTHSPK